MLPKFSNQEFAAQIRIESLKMVHNANASHIGSALSIADILAVLYNEILNVYPKNPRHPQRDRFVLSKGHACVSVYAALALRNFFPISQLKSYGSNFSKLMNHISHKVEGVEFSTGALGHGLSFGIGLAMASKFSGNNYKTFVLLSDGEMQEGSNWEGFMFASHHRLENLTILIDYNNLQSLKTVDETLAIEPLKDKLFSFGLEVLEADGHDYNDISFALKQNNSQKPKAVIFKTTKGKGVSFMENQVAWHYKTPNADELKRAISELIYA